MIFGCPPGIHSYAKQKTCVPSFRLYPRSYPNNFAADLSKLELHLANEMAYSLLISLFSRS